MNIDRVRVLLGMGAFVGAAGCHVYVDEPARQPQTAAAKPPPPPPPKLEPAPAKPVKVIPLKMHGAEPAGGTTPAPAPVCLDTGAATPGDCSGVQASSGCASVPTAQQKCAAYKTYFQPKVAAAAVSCMTSLTAAQACDATQTSSCAKAALAKACTDPSVTQLCQIAAASCKTSATDCASTLSGLNDPGKQAVAQCVAQGCAAGLSSCIDALAAPAAVSAKH
jgi:hypothetical protein